MVTQYYQKYYQYLNGKFALVDSYYRTIWFVINNEDEAYAIKKIFVSKISFIVVDLTTFTNFTVNENTVDSEVCFYWQVAPVNAPKNISYSLVFDVNRTYTADDFNSPKLINQSASTLLDSNTQLEIQDQIFLYQKILQEFTGSLLYAAADQSRKSLDFYNSTNSSKNTFIDEIDLIFLTELKLSDIENKLTQTALSHLGTAGTLPIALLKIIGKSIYE